MIKVAVFQFPWRKTDQPLNCVRQSGFFVNIKLAMNGYRQTHQADNKAADESIPCRKWLEGRGKWQCLAVDSLSLHASVEAGVSEAYAKPGQETCDGCHVGEPVEHLAGAG